MQSFAVLKRRPKGFVIAPLPPCNAGNRAPGAPLADAAFRPTHLAQLDARRSRPTVLSCEPAQAPYFAASHQHGRSMAPGRARDACEVRRGDPPPDVAPTSLSAQ